MSVWTAEERGQFGDMFGASNALFSGLAFIGLIYAILLQRSELALQRIELKLTRKEMKGSREQLKLQKQQMEIQNFENRFFQMVKLWNELRSSLDSYENLKDRGFFKGYVEPHLKQSIRDQPSGADAMGVLDTIDCAIKDTYGTVWVGLPNYMRMLYNTIKLIDHAEIELKDKKFYANIVRTQLSRPELVVIFYNCLSELGREKFKPLVEKYSLLKHLNHGDLVEGNHAGQYSHKAFE